MASAARVALGLLLALSVVTLLSPPAQGEDLPLSFSDDGRLLRAGDTDLTLAAQGILSAVWIDIYGCELYLPRPVASSDELRAPDLAIAASIRILVADTLAEVPERWRRILRREVSDGAYAGLEHIYRSITKGDWVMFLYRPVDGTRILYNGHTIARVDGKSLMNAVLDQWIGDDPESEELRTALTHGLASR